MPRVTPIGAMTTPPAASRFDYSAPAELFMVRTRAIRSGPAGYRRFPKAADAIRFAVEEVPAALRVGVVMEVDEERFDHRGISELYARADYPHARS